MVEGAHYKGDGEEHHKRVMRLRLNWYQANITKYTERAYRKGQTEDDIKKIIVYAQLWLAMEEGAEPGPGYVNQDRD